MYSKMPTDLFSGSGWPTTDSVGYFDGDEEVAVDARYYQIIMTACIFLLFFFSYIIF